jgi:NADPH:quinone reductase-like Zn-dependent oxidoreductase
MKALIQLHDGYSGRSEGPQIDKLEPYLSFGDMAVPEPGEGQVLIKVAMAAVNPSDLHFIKGEYGQPRRRGFAAGFEGTGTVVSGKGQYAESLVGKRIGFTTGATGTGCWADYAVADASGCIPVRPDLRDEDASALIVNPLTAVAMFDIVRKSGAKSFVMTAGASQVSKLMLGLGKDHGIAPIVTVRRSGSEDYLKELGAAHVLVETDVDFMDKFAAICKAEKPIVLIDAVANQISANLFFAMPNRTKWVVYGKLDMSAVDVSKIATLVFTGKTITGFWLVEWFRSTPVEEQIKVIAEVQERFVSGKWHTDVAAIVPLTEAMEKLPVALNSRAGKVMIRP